MKYRGWIPWLIALYWVFAVAIGRCGGAVARLRFRRVLLRLHRLVVGWWAPIVVGGPYLSVGP